MICHGNGMVDKINSYLSLVELIKCTMKSIKKFNCLKGLILIFLWGIYWTFKKYKFSINGFPEICLTKSSINFKARKIYSHSKTTWSFTQKKLSTSFQRVSILCLHYRESWSSMCQFIVPDFVSQKLYKFTTPECVWLCQTCIQTFLNSTWTFFSEFSEYLR